MLRGRILRCRCRKEMTNKKFFVDVPKSHLIFVNNKTAPPWATDQNGILCEYAGIFSTIQYFQSFQTCANRENGETSALIFNQDLRCGLEGKTMWDGLGWEWMDGRGQQAEDPIDDGWSLGPPQHRRNLNPTSCGILTCCDNSKGLQRN